MDAMLQGMIANLRYDDEASVKDAIGKVHNDEHIHTAIQARIMSRAFVVNLSHSTCSARGILYEAGSTCAIGCVKTSHDDPLPIHGLRLRRYPSRVRRLIKIPRQEFIDAVNWVIRNAR